MATKRFVDGLEFEFSTTREQNRVKSVCRRAGRSSSLTIDVRPEVGTDLVRDEQVEWVASQGWLSGDRVGPLPIREPIAVGTGIESAGAHLFMAELALRGLPAVIAEPDFTLHVDVDSHSPAIIRVVVTDDGEVRRRVKDGCVFRRWVPGLQLSDRDLVAIVDIHGTARNATIYLGRTTEIEQLFTHSHGPEQRIARMTDPKWENYKEGWDNLTRLVVPGGRPCRVSAA